jgi:hypothetical protein
VYKLAGRTKIAQNRILHISSVGFSPTLFVFLRNKKAQQMRKIDSFTDKSTIKIYSNEKASDVCTFVCGATLGQCTNESRRRKNIHTKKRHEIFGD